MADLFVILLKDCGKECDDIVNQLNAPSMRKFLKEEFQVDQIKRLNAETDDLAAQIMISAEDYQLPILAILKKGSPEQVCTLKKDPVEIERCVDLKKIEK
jgi:hypothetical protein